MDKMFNPVGFYDFFSYFVPGLIFISAVGLLHGFSATINGDTFKISIVILLIFILSYVSGRILKVFFEAVTRFSPCWNFFYRLHDIDRNDESVTCRIYKTVNLLNGDYRILDGGDNQNYYMNNYKYYNYNDRNSYGKKMIIEQAATILRQNNIEGDFIMYHHLKYFFQLISAALLSIFIIYFTANFSKRFFPLEQFQNIFEENSFLFIVLVIFFSLILIREILFLTKCTNKLTSFFDKMYILIILLITFFVFSYSSKNTLYPKQTILLFSLPCFFLFREMFISTYQLYLNDVIRSYCIYKKDVSG